MWQIIKSTLALPDMLCLVYKRVPCFKFVWLTSLTVASWNRAFWRRLGFSCGFSFPPPKSHTFLSRWESDIDVTEDKMEARREKIREIEAWLKQALPPTVPDWILDADHDEDSIPTYISAPEQATQDQSRSPRSANQDLQTTPPQQAQDRSSPNSSNDRTPPPHLALDQTSPPLSPEKQKPRLPQDQAASSYLDQDLNTPPPFDHDQQSLPDIPKEDILQMPMMSLQPSEEGMSAGKGKRMRTSFNKQQLHLMSAHFQINKKPNSVELDILSQQTNLNAKVLSVWFKNARAKWSRTKTQEGPKEQVPHIYNLENVAQDQSPQSAHRDLETLPPQNQAPSQSAQEQTPPIHFAKDQTSAQDETPPAHHSPQDQPLCAGCKLHITDAALLHVPETESKWHSDCLKCGGCVAKLEGRKSCFAEDDGVIFCKDCNVRRSDRCARCGGNITDQGIRALNSLFHPDCFICVACKAVLRDGDSYVIVKDKPYCQRHCRPVPVPALPNKAGPNQHLLSVGPHRQYFPQGPFRQGYVLPPPSMGPGAPPQHGAGLSHCQGNNEPKKKRRDRKRKPKVKVEDKENGNPSTEAGAAGKARRARTLFDRQQLRILDNYFQTNQKPNRQELDMLSQRTNLDKKVVAVWFQNARAKWRKTEAQDSIVKQESCINSPQKVDQDQSLSTQSAHQDLPTPNLALDQTMPPQSVQFQDPHLVHDQTTSSYSDQDLNTPPYDIPEEQWSQPHISMEIAHEQMQVITPQPIVEGAAAGMGRRARTLFTDQQLHILRAHFQKNQKPNLVELDMLSKKIGIHKKVLTTWFINARAKLRKANTQEGTTDKEAPNVSDQ